MTHTCILIKAKEEYMDCEITSCCGHGPITRENFCSECGRAIVRDNNTPPEAVCDPEFDEKVVVTNSEKHPEDWSVRHFSHKRNGQFYCFPHGFNAENAKEVRPYLKMKRIIIFP